MEIILKGVLESTNAQILILQIKMSTKVHSKAELNNEESILTKLILSLSHPFKRLLSDLDI